MGRPNVITYLESPLSSHTYKHYYQDAKYLFNENLEG